MIQPQTEEGQAFLRYLSAGTDQTEEMTENLAQRIRRIESEATKAALARLCVRDVVDTARCSICDKEGH